MHKLSTAPPPRTATNNLVIPNTPPLLLRCDPTVPLAQGLDAALSCPPQPAYITVVPEDRTSAPLPKLSRNFFCVVVSKHTPLPPSSPTGNQPPVPRAQGLDAAPARPPQPKGSRKHSGQRGSFSDGLDLPRSGREPPFRDVRSPRGAQYQFVTPALLLARAHRSLRGRV